MNTFLEINKRKYYELPFGKMFDPKWLKSLNIFCPFLPHKANPVYFV